MLLKKNRVSSKDVDLIFKSGKSISSPSFTFKFLKTTGKECRISFITPKSVAKIAVRRNLLRRRGYSVLRNYLTDFPLGIVGVFLFKKYQEDILIIENEIKNILSKIN